MTSLYDAAGDVFQEIADALHARCLADPELNHPFSHADQNPEHVPRLGWYLAEVCGGPASYTQAGGDHTLVLRMHAGEGEMDELGDRFVACFVLALADVGVPSDVREPLALCMRQATDQTLLYPHDRSAVPADQPMPRWTWTGIEF